MKPVYYYSPTRVYLERGCLYHRLPEVRALGTRLLLVTGRRFAQESGLLAGVKKCLVERGMSVDVFSDVDPEPPIENVEEGASFCRKHGCDAIVAVGGGSALDVAKGIAVLAKNPGRLADYFGEAEYAEQPLPIAAVPTTCGTGSEVTRYAVIVDRAAGTKKTVSSERIIPRIAICDSALLDTLPAKLIAATGMDALSHSVEGFLAKRATALTKMYARESIRVLVAALPGAVGATENTAPRERTMYGSLLAGFVINYTGTIIVHGIGYALTVKYGLHHGTANALLLPHVLSYLKEKGYGPLVGELEGMWGNNSLSGFVAGLGLPVRLREIGVTEDDMPELVMLAAIGCERSVKNMHIPPEPDAYQRILMAAL